MSARKLRWRKDGARNLSIEDACWQYLLDHAQVAHNNVYFKGTLDTKEKFLYSLKARIEGRYRYSEEDIANKIAEKLKSYETP